MYVAKPKQAARTKVLFPSPTVHWVLHPER